MPERPLRKVVIGDVDIALPGLRQVLARAAGRQDFADAAVKARHSAMGWDGGRDEAVLAVLCGAGPVAALLTGRWTLTGGAATGGERLAVIGQDRGDLKGGRLEEVGQKALGAGGGRLGRLST
ncbi:MAG: hypothetical protein KAX51_09460 [Chromatiaceae bacterium]|nr:hypothetical protein [Chromatiaceae bacterium]